MTYFVLNDQNKMPQIGCGTSRYGKVDGDFFAELNHDPKEMLQAIDVGYEMFDTAIIYRNEDLVGEALKIRNVNRKTMYLESKIDFDDQYVKTDELVEQSIASSLKKLQTNYIDLYLIHRPSENNEENLRVWRVLETYHKQGILKSIGVSNFMVPQLTYLIEHAEIQPAVNQVKSNPSNWNKEIIAYCKSQDVLPQIYSPLRSVDEELKEKLANAGKPFNKSWAQVLLRYHLDNGCQVIPMSYDKSHQAQNLDILDFELPKDIFNDIKSL